MSVACHVLNHKYFDKYHLCVLLFAKVNMLFMLPAIEFVYID